MLLDGDLPQHQLKGIRGDAVIGALDAKILLLIHVL
jgi:hypothetical protein